MIGVYKKSKYSIYLAAYATMVLALIWGLFSCTCSYQARIFSRYVD